MYHVLYMKTEYYGLTLLSSQKHWILDKRKRQHSQTARKYEPLHLYSQVAKGTHPLSDPFHSHCNW